MQACRNNLRNLNLLESSNASLLLSRYLKYAAADDDNFRKAREELINSAIRTIRNAEAIYRYVFSQWKDRINANFKAKFKTDGRSVIGLGSESPIETGLRLHYTYGTPFIPGSALKGLAAHYCHKIWGILDREYSKEVNDGDNKRAGKYFETLFGTTDDSGHIIFHDSWITPESLRDSLQKDIMTVHHPDYYQKEDVPPSDFDDPTPIPFISVKGDFIIPIACDVDGEEGEKWAELALKLITEALKNCGIGGKTTSGYGRMSKIDDGKTNRTKTVHQEENKITGGPISDFIQWFDKTNFSNPKNKGMQGQIKDKMEKCKDIELKKKAKEYVLNKIDKKLISKGILSYFDTI